MSDYLKSCWPVCIMILFFSLKLFLGPNMFWNAVIFAPVFEEAFKLVWFTLTVNFFGKLKNNLHFIPLTLVIIASIYFASFEHFTEQTTESPLMFVGAILTHISYPLFGFYFYFRNNANWGDEFVWLIMASGFHSLHNSLLFVLRAFVELTDSLVFVYDLFLVMMATCLIHHLSNKNKKSHKT